ncbi:helix-turn-helix domain-containing protein [Sporosarcina sp. 179-K 3D1 HS]|uniref:helix-turn-helix domain-containing protein n=1 Tax=Sporosarcina sp. 179-K 3D1 HS TaxID=3232169 RepID=UPI0039A0FB33
MKNSKSDVILHPVRMRIIQTLINGRKLTVQQIGERLQDVPQATLYRHLKKLLDANVIEVVGEYPVRGAVEKVYSLPEASASISVEEFSAWSAEEHMDAFMRFMVTVLADFERYVHQEEFDLLRDGAGYRQMTFYASDEELREFTETMRAEFMKLLGNEATEQRRRRTMTTIVTTENK